jgi:hypothetical protein
MTQAFNLSQLANNVNSSGQLAGSAVTGTVPASSVAGDLTTTNFHVFQSGSKLYFQYNGSNIASLDSSGNFICVGTVTSAGTP